MSTVTLHDVEAFPRPIEVPSFVPVMVSVYDGAAAQVVGVRTLIWPSQKPMERGNPGGGLEKAQVTTVLIDDTVDVMAGTTRVPAADRSGTDRETPQFVRIGG